MLQYVNKAGEESVLFVYNLAEYPENAVLKTTSSRLVRLRGLQEDGHYRIEGVEGVYTGKMLMNIGIVLPLRGAYKSSIIRICRVG